MSRPGKTIPTATLDRVHTLLVAEPDGLRARDLCELAELSSSHMTRALARLVAAGRVVNVRAGRAVVYRAVAA